MSFGNIIFWYLNFNLHHRWYLSFEKIPNWYLSQVFRQKTNGPLSHCHLAPLGTRHMSLATCQNPHNCQITQTLPHHIPTSFTDFGGKWQLCECWHVARDVCRVVIGAKWQWCGRSLVFVRKTWLKYQFSLFSKLRYHLWCKLKLRYQKIKLT